MGENFEDGINGSIQLFEFIVSILAVLFNAVVLVAVVKARISLYGYKHFLISLTIGDLLSSVVTIGKHVVQLLVDPLLARCWLQPFRSLQFVCFTANLLNICGMSVDHFIGIIMTKKTVRLSIIGLWCFSMTIGFADVPISMAQQQLASLAAGGGAEMPVPCSTNGTSSPALNDLYEALFGMIEDDQQFANESDGDKSDESTFRSLSSQDDAFTTDEPTTLSRFTTMSLKTNSSGSKKKAKNKATPTNQVKPRRVKRAATEEMDSCTMEREMAASLKAAEDNQQPPCLFSSGNSWMEVSVMALAAICLLILSICYGKIFAVVKESLFESAGSASKTRKRPEKNIRKLVVTTFILLGTFIICWMPFMCYEFVMLVTVQNGINLWQTHSASLLIVNYVFNSMLMTHPLIDPIIYAARVVMIQRSIINMFRSIFCVDLLRNKSETWSASDVGPSEHKLSRRLTYRTHSKRKSEKLSTTVTTTVSDSSSSLKKMPIKGQPSLNSSSAWV